MTKNQQEQAWRGEFGDSYVDRNQFDQDHIEKCAGVFSKIFQSLPEGNALNSILEIGCNNGRNLEALKTVTNAELFGIEPNAKARAELSAKNITPDSHIKDALGSDIPFNDQSMDLVFTSVVLIHVPDDGLENTLKEIHRTSRKYILAMEYFNPNPHIIQYRGHNDLLFKRDYGSLYMDMFPDLKLLDYGFFWKRIETSQDNTTWWLFEKTA